MKAVSGSLKSWARSLGLLHDLEAEEDGEDVGQEGEDEGDTQQPAGRPAETTEEVAEEGNTEGLGRETTLSLVSVNVDGAGTLKDCEDEDQPGEFGGWVNVCVELVHFL